MVEGRLGWVVGALTIEGDCVGVEGRVGMVSV